MAKKGVYKISGNTNPKVGEKTFYTIEEWYPETSLSARNPANVTWELFVKVGDEFESTNIRKKGINHFTFGSKAHQFTYKIEGYLYRPEGKSPMSIIVQPQKNEDPPKQKDKEILGVNLTYEDGSEINKVLSYKDRLKAIAKCEGMEGEKVVFTLWEDDAEKAGHNKNNQYITKSPPVEVNKYGKAIWIFPLSSTFISLANKKEDDRKQHEYYVTTEYNGKRDASGNVNVNNPEYRQPVLKPVPPKKQTGRNSAPKIQPKKDTPKASTKQISPNNQADKKGNIISIKLADAKGKAFTKTPKFGETIQVIIEGKDLVGKKYNLRIWEHDLIGENDLLYNQVHTFKTDKQIVYTALTKEMEQTGRIGNDQKNPDSGEYTAEWNSHQEIFAEVIFLHISSKSSTIDVGLKEEHKPVDHKKSPSTIDRTDAGKEDGKCFCKENQFRWGTKLTCEERKKVLQVCAALWGEENKIQKASELMSVIHLETNKSFKPSADNGAGYTGLIQFSDAAAKSVGTTRAELKKMTFVQQMDYVKKYFEKKKDALKTMTDLYLLVLKQNAVGQGGNTDYVLFDEGVSVPNVPYDRDNLTKEPWVTKYGYSSNPTFMREKGEWQNRRMFKSYSKGTVERRGFPNGKTYVSEVTDVLTKEHYNLGKLEIFNGECENKPKKKDKPKGKRAPWVDVGFEEFEKYKGLAEKESPLKEKISKYFAGTGNSDLDYTNPWCAAFIKWCFDHTDEYKNINSKGTAAAFDWAEYGNSKVVNNKYVDGWKNGEKCEPFVGAIITFNFSHTAILVGENLKGDKYVYLGGNQGNGDSRSGYQKICLGSISKKSPKIFMMMKPKTYMVENEEKLLPKYNVEAENSAGSSR